MIDLDDPDAPGQRRPAGEGIQSRGVTLSKFRRELQVEADHVVEADELAVVQTPSTGTVTRLEYGATTEVPYRDLSVRRRSGDGWLVVACMFSSASGER